MAVHDYRCSRCRNGSPSGLLAMHRYSRTEKRRVKVRQRNKQRIHIGGEYHSFVQSAEQASRINAHIKGRLNAFKGQQARAQMEGVAPDAVCVQAAV
jgi:hypothetical protein